MRLGDLRGLETAQRTERVEAFVRSAKRAPNGGLDALNAEIRKLEVEHEMTSAELREGIRSGKVRDTAAVSRWLVLLDARDRATR